MGKNGILKNMPGAPGGKSTYQSTLQSLITEHGSQGLGLEPNEDLVRTNIRI